MKSLRLTVLLDNNVSKADLANTFGNFTEINLSNKYLQFKFESTRMLTAMQISPIYKLIESYEKQHGQKLHFKMFHLYDDDDDSYSPISLQCLGGEVWTITSSNSGADLHSSPNLLTLI